MKEFRTIKKLIFIILKMFVTSKMTYLPKMTKIHKSPLCVFFLN